MLLIQPQGSSIEHRRVSFGRVDFQRVSFVRGGFCEGVCETAQGHSIEHRRVSSVRGVVSGGSLLGGVVSVRVPLRQPLRAQRGI